MVAKRTVNALMLSLCLAGAVLIGRDSDAADRGRLSVAVTEPDVEAIVKVVGGDHVDAFSLFKGCILRKDLMVETDVRGRLLKADVLVWTGFFNESAAIHDSVKALDGSAVKSAPVWIDVSRDVKRVNVPTSSCYGYVEVSFMHGDPFFWLNPENGKVIARNVAEGLGDLRPEWRETFLANAGEFSAKLDKDIARWTQELKPLAGLRIFSAQCGWQNFTQIGGPAFASCKKSPGVLPAPDELAKQMIDLKVEIILVDPNTPPEYGRAFRKLQHVKVVEVPSSLESLPAGGTYSSLFDNLIRSLKEAAGS